MTITPYDPEIDDNSDANSYGSVAAFRLYAEARGLTIPDDDGDCEVLLLQAMDYLEAIGDGYKGIRTSDFATEDAVNTDAVVVAQPLQWPRTGVFLYSSQIQFDPTLIPTNLISAQCLIAAAVAGGATLYPIVSTSMVKRRKTDVLEKEFFQPGTPGGGNPDGTPLMPGVDALLSPLLESGSFRLTNVRV